MPDEPTGDAESPAHGTDPSLDDWRTDWQNIPERRRERARREAAGVSRDLAASLLAGGGA